MAITLATPGTVTGMVVNDVPLGPVVPPVPEPQHDTVPSLNTAQACTAPTAMITAVEIPTTSTGVAELLRSPVPNCPSLLSPKHLMPPVVRVRHVKGEFPKAVDGPAAMSRA